MTTYYRVAIAGGKTIAFTNTVEQPGRLLSVWMAASTTSSAFWRITGYRPGRVTGDSNLYYKGSMVSLYWNQYATGTFKCCTLVYNPPNRQYYVSIRLFASPQNLPPGTPMFRNVDNLSYRQNQVARTN